MVVDPIVPSKPASDYSTITLRFYPTTLEGCRKLLLTIAGSSVNLLV